ncbi:hypothetical protein [Amycolatopsis tucumanensis]|uniref:Uncharacterized protein n=1 Tax=Amycolatopsis tucumanensis TaxID=401106 RepID=A0ABP7JR20_9PSEU|nr:hypothetical protein [Amycolatopsis tucumanensis]MCF6424988.1 hypothetical protein [Amycolatopsis tucumanensis]
MQDRKKRKGWTVLAVVLPGPWTPVIVLAYLLGRAAESDQDTAPGARPAPTHVPGPDPFAPPRNPTSYPTGGA